MHERINPILLASSSRVSSIKDHSFSTYAKFSEKQTFLTPLYVHVRVRIRGQELEASGKRRVRIKRTDPKSGDGMQRFA